MAASDNLECQNRAKNRTKRAKKVLQIDSRMAKTGNNAPRKLTEDEKAYYLCSPKHRNFIARAKKLHPNAYDYSETVYISATEKVKIKCPAHGVFYQTPTVHVNQKSGCPECGVLRRGMRGRGLVDAVRKGDPVELLKDYAAWILYKLAEEQGMLPKEMLAEVVHVFKVLRMNDGYLPPKDYSK